MGLFWFHMPLALGAGAQKITGRADLFGACPKALIGERYENWHARDVAPLSYDVEFSKVFPILVRFGAARKTRMSIRIPHLPLGFLVFLLCLKAAIAVAEQAQKPLVIFAAASLKDALEEVVALHAAAHEGPPVLISLASSGALARQIQFGAPADLIISANRAWVSLLEKEGLIKRARPAFSNQLVVASSVEPEQNIDFTRRETFKAALADGYLAVGHVGSVPAGLYAHQALTYFDLWNDLAPQILQVDHVRAALRLAQVNEARLAIVYASDLVAQTTVHKVASVPEEAHEPIIYTIGLLSQNSTQAAGTFADFLTSKPALEVFYHFGFTPLR